MQTADPTRSHPASNQPTAKPGATPRVWTSLTCAVVVMGAGLSATITGLNSDTVIARSFDRAFAALPAPAGPSTSLSSAAPFDGIAGTEDDWLRLPANANIVQAVAIGQEIRLTDNGTVRRLTITSIRDGGDAQTHIDTSPVRARVVLITCREGDTATGRETRLRLEGGHIREIAVDAVPHAL